jgi:hypothetical protein
MAVGDSVISHSSIANSASLTIQPGSAGVEWLITNLYFGGAWELYRTDGSNTIKIDSGSGVRMLTSIKLKATYTTYFTIKNVSGGTVYMGYDGVIWK